MDDSTQLCVFKEVSERVDGRAHLQCERCGRMMWRCKSPAAKAIARCKSPAADSPTFFGMMASAANAVVNLARDGGRMVSREDRDERMTICRECPQFEPQLVRCGSCKCFLAIKAWLPKEKCPLDKWPVSSPASAR